MRRIGSWASRWRRTTTSPSRSATASCWPACEPSCAVARLGSPWPHLLAARVVEIGACTVCEIAETAELQQFYAGIKQVTASFRQAVTNDTFGSTKTSDGTVWIMKPGKMRWDYLEKKKTGVLS